MAPWKSPRCSPSCWDEIKQHDAEHAKLVMALAHMTRDRDEWKHQHENLLAIYQASHLPGLPQTPATKGDAE